MKPNKIDHICIAVKDLDAARRVWEPVLGKAGPDDPYVYEPEQIRVARYWVGGVGFELVESTTPEGPVARWIERHGEGVMVLGFNVDSTREAVEQLQEEGYPFIPDDQGTIVRSFRGSGWALIHPKKLTGVLTEVIDYPWDELKGCTNT